MKHTETMYTNVDDCLFCETKKTWRSTITLKDELNKVVIAKVTVCPRCRAGRTIGELHLVATQRMIDGNPIFNKPSSL